MHTFLKKAGGILTPIDLAGKFTTCQLQMQNIHKDAAHLITVVKLDKTKKTGNMGLETELFYHHATDF